MSIMDGENTQGWNVFYLRILMYDGKHKRKFWKINDFFAFLLLIFMIWAETKSIFFRLCFFPFFRRQNW